MIETTQLTKSKIFIVLLPTEKKMLILAMDQLEDNGNLNHIEFSNL